MTAVERRITSRLVGYWERIRGERVMPNEVDINPDDLQDLWDDCFLVHARDLKMQDYNYIYLGLNIAHMYQEGIKGDLEHFNASKLSKGFQKVIDTKKPVLEEGGIVNALGRTLLYRQCLLPLGSGDAVDAILGGIRYKLI
jgi:hypothetical protein